MSTRKGFFKPINPQKYKGDVTNIFYRSGYELRLMSHFDMHEDVIWWSSEEKSIPYVSPVDGKWHRYYVDFIIKIKNKNNEEEIIMIEVKPKKETQPPDLSKIKRKDRMIKEVTKWGINNAKWNYAKKYCESKKWKFLIMTEEEIFGKSK